MFSVLPGVKLATANLDSLLCFSKPFVKLRKYHFSHSVIKYTHSVNKSSANLSLQAKSRPSPRFVNKVMLECFCTLWLLCYTGIFQ